jgi:RNA polymerase sigma-70 factor (ECF subfamily)
MTFDDPTALTQHRSSLLRLATRWTRSRFEAEDLVQETLLVAFREAGRFDGRASPRAWLFGILANVARHRVRSVSRRERLRSALLQESSQEPESPECALLSKDRAGRLRRAVDELPPELREVLVRFDIEGRPGADIARELELPIGTVWTRLRKARSLLADELRLEHRTRGSWFWLWSPLPKLVPAAALACVTLLAAVPPDANEATPDPAPGSSSLARTPPVQTHAVTILDAPLTEIPVKAPEAKHRPAPRKRRPQEFTQNVEQGSSAPRSGSEERALTALEEEIALFREASRRASDGELPAAMALFDELALRFPQGHLAPEVRRRRTQLAAGTDESPSRTGASQGAEPRGVRELPSDDTARPRRPR